MSRPSLTKQSQDTAIIRLESICPFPAGRIQEELAKYQNAKGINLSGLSKWISLHFQTFFKSLYGLKKSIGIWDAGHSLPPGKSFLGLKSRPTMWGLIPEPGSGTSPEVQLLNVLCSDLKTSAECDYATRDGEFCVNRL